MSCLRLGGVSRETPAFKGAPFDASGSGEGTVVWMTPPLHLRGLRCVNGGAGKIFTAEGAEMVGVNDHPEQPLRSPRALR